MLGGGLGQLLQPRELPVDLARTCSGRSTAASCSRSSSTSASPGSRSPSSSWIALSCWRSTYSRWLRSSSDWTCDWMREPIVGDLELAREDLRQPPQATRDVALLEQGLLLLGLEAQRAGDQVRQRGGVVQVGDGHLELLREVRDVLDDARERLLHVAHQRGQLRPLRDDVGQLGRHARRGTAARASSPRPHARAGLHEDPQRAVGHLEHARDRAGHADVVELVGPGRLQLGVAAGDHREHAVAAEHVVDQADRALLADRERRQRVREGDGVAQRQDRQRGGSSAAADRDLLAAGARGGDLDHASRPRGWIGTVRGRRRARRAAARRSGCRPRRSPSRRRRRRRRRARRRGGTARAGPRSAGRGAPRRRPRGRRWPARISSRPRISSSISEARTPASSARTTARGGSAA